MPAKRYALDGVRSDLSDPAEIIALMAQDLNDIRREDGAVTQPQLFAVGWTRRQVADHFHDALERAFATFSETRPSASFDTESDQAKPFLTFDASMRERLANARASDFDRETRAHLARFEEFQGCVTTKAAD